MIYSLTYAGVPLLSDKSHAFNLPSQRIPYGQTERQLPNREQQVEPELIDEINRLLELGLIVDNAYPSNYPGKNLSRLAKKWPIYQWPDFSLRVNEWYYPVGASKWSVFRGLATSTMVQTMLLATLGGSPAPFIMQAAPISPDNLTGDSTLYTLETMMYMLPPRPLAQHGNGLAGLYLLTFLDERFYWQGINSSLWPLLNNNATWAQLINQLARDLNINILIPSIPAAYGQPEVDSQLWTNLESSAALLDCVAYNIGCSVVRNFNGNYSLLSADASTTIVDSNRGLAQNVVRLAGGDLFYENTWSPTSQNMVLPQSVIVTFPKYVVANDPVPHFFNPRYRVTAQRPTAWDEDSYGDVWFLKVPLLSGGINSLGVSGYVSSGLIGVSGINVVLHDTAKALYSGDVQAISGNAPLNVSGLTQLALQLSHDMVFSYQADRALDEVYPGTFDWTPEGIHDIVWTYSDRKRLAATRVIRPMWNGLVVNYQHGTPLTSGYSSGVLGVGGRSVAQTWQTVSGSFLSGTIIGGVNLVTVISGTISGFLHSGGVQEVILSIPTGGGGGHTWEIVNISGLIVDPDVHSVTLDSEGVITDALGLTTLSGSIQISGSKISVTHAGPAQVGTMTNTVQFFSGQKYFMGGKVVVGDISGTAGLGGGFASGYSVQIFNDTVQFVPADAVRQGNVIFGPIGSSPSLANTQFFAVGLPHNELSMDINNNFTLSGSTKPTGCIFTITNARSGVTGDARSEALLYGATTAGAPGARYCIDTDTGVLAGVTLTLSPVNSLQIRGGIIISGT